MTPDPTQQQFAYIQQTLTRIESRLERWIEQHERYHREEAEGVSESTQRITRLESQVQTRSWMGGLGMLLTGLAGMFVKPGGA
jgi:hypothetical protein